MIQQERSTAKGCLVQKLALSSDANLNPYSQIICPDICTKDQAPTPHAKTKQEATVLPKIVRDQITKDSALAKLGEKLESKAGIVGDLTNLALAYGVQVALFASSPAAYALISGSLVKFALHSLLLTPLALFCANITLDGAIDSVERKIHAIKKDPTPVNTFSEKLAQSSKYVLQLLSLAGLNILTFPISGIGTLTSNLCMKLGKALKTCATH